VWSIGISTWNQRGTVWYQDAPLLIRDGSSGPWSLRPGRSQRYLAPMCQADLAGRV